MAQYHASHFYSWLDVESAEPKPVREMFLTPLFIISLHMDGSGPRRSVTLQSTTSDLYSRQTSMAGACVPIRVELNVILRLASLEVIS